MPLSDSNNEHTVLTTNNLTVGYDHGTSPKIILERIDVQLNKGELVCLLGENGVGKSTLLKTLSKVIPPLSGSIYLGQTQLSDYNQNNLARKISLVLANPQRPAMLKVQEIVSLGRYPFTGWGGGLKGEDHARIQQAMELTGIDYLKDEVAGTLSDGQMQKVMIARALAQDSDIMILDEPTAHLDITNRLSLMHLLKTLTRETNKSILVSTHDLDLAFHNADRLWLATCCLPIVTGSPEELILNGEVANLFDDDALKFDYQQGRFRTNVSSSNTIELTGNDNYYLWTKNGLERLGFKVVERDGLAKVKIVAGENKSRTWYFEKAGQQVTFKEITSLLDFLNREIKGQFGD